MSIEMQCRFSRNDFNLTVELAVANGELVLVTGPNGSGKSTLLKLIAGLLPIEQGLIRLGGQIVDQLPSPERRRIGSLFVQPEVRHVGLLPQGGALFPHLSVLDNVGFGLWARGLPSDMVRSRAVGMLEKFGLAGMAHRRPHELSGGQQQRVAIARTLAPSPRVLLLDEPMAALDPDARASLAAMLRDLRTSFDGPILFVSHEPNVDLGDRVRCASLVSEDKRGSQVVHLEFP